MLKRVYGHFMEDSLYRNSIYLILNTGIMAGLGFVFWIIVARMYAPAQVGVGSALISVIGLISGISMLGLNVALIRYLPASQHKNDKINTVLTITGIAALFVSTVYLLGLSWWSPDLLFLTDNLWSALFFIVAMVIMTLFNVVDNVFIAYRSSQHVLLKGVVFALGKIAFPIFFVLLGALGIFVSWVLAATIGLIVVFVSLVLNFRFRPTFSYDVTLLKRMMGYSAGNYLAGFINGLPVMILPLIVLHRLGATSAAHYFVAMQIATVLFFIPQAITSSLFAEGSHSVRDLNVHVKKAAFFSALIVIPAMFLVIVFGGVILDVFGSQYSGEGLGLLRLLTYSLPLVVVGQIILSVLRIQERMGAVLVVVTIGTVATLLAIYLDGGDLLSIGWSWMWGQAALVVAGVATLSFSS